jgi:trimethylamine--corrinoid protein Co-methyltransferase
MRLEVLSKDDIERVDEATMGVLERTGVAVYERQSLDVLEENGAPVDRASSRARLPERMVREALERAPSRVKLAGRHGGRNVELGSGRTYFTNSLQGIKVLQLGSGEVRDSLLSDIPVFAKLVDALPNIDFYGVTVVAHDVPGEFHYLKELAAAVENTTKHIEHGCHGTAMAKAYVRIAQVVSGGEEELRKNPAVSSFGCPVSPLQCDRANTEAMVECAKAGMPYDVLSMAMAGASSPMTLAGTLTMINAEVLAGMTICELLNPGTPVIYGSVASIMDMRTGVMALGAPERPVLNGAVVQMAHSYGLPSLVGGMSTDGKLPGPQVLMEKAITGLPPALAGSDVVLGPAGLGHDLQSRAARDRQRGGRCHRQGQHRDDSRCGGHRPGPDRARGARRELPRHEAHDGAHEEEHLDAGAVRQEHLRQLGEARGQGDAGEGGGKGPGDARQAQRQALGKRAEAGDRKDTRRGLEEGLIAA